MPDQLTDIEYAKLLRSELMPALDSICATMQKALLVGIRINFNIALSPEGKFGAQVALTKEM